jgi:ankyrin repeat protein
MGKSDGSDKKQEFGRAREAITNMLKAANDGDVAKLKECVAKQAAYDGTDDGGILAAMQDGNERRALHFAAKAGKLATVSYIVTLAAELEAEPKRDIIDSIDIEGETPLSLACREAVEPRAAVLIAQQLIDKGGADPSHASKSGSCALHHAVHSDNIELVKYLLGKGANADAIGEMGTPLLSAVMYGRDESVAALLEASADPNVGAGQVPPAICAAAAMGNGDMVTLLLGAGGSVSAVDNDGWTPLHCALDGNHRDVADLLLKAGADPGVKDKKGLTAADFMAGLAPAPAPAAPTAESAAIERPSLDPETREKVDALKQQGNDAIKTQDFDAAIAHYSEAIELDAFNCVLFGNRAAAKLKLKQYEAALADAQEAKRLAPEWVKAFYREGEAFWGMENYGDAAASFWEGLQLEPSNKEMRRRFNEAVEIGKKKHREEHGGGEEEEEEEDSSSSSSSDEDDEDER